MKRSFLSPTSLFILVVALVAALSLQSGLNLVLLFSNPALILLPLAVLLGSAMIAFAAAWGAWCSQQRIEQR